MQSNIKRCDAAGLMNIWNNLSELKSDYSKSNDLFIQKLEELNVQLCPLAYTPKLLRNYKFLCIEFQKAKDEKLGSINLETISRCAKTLLLSGITNDTQFKNLPLDDLIHLLRECKHVSNEMMKKFINHPCIKTMSQETYKQYLEEAAIHGQSEFANIWSNFKPKGPVLREFCSPEINAINALICAETVDDDLYRQALDFKKRNPNYQFQEALITIIENDKLELLKWFIETLKIDTMQRFNDKFLAPLQGAASMGHLGIVQYLIEEAKVVPFCPSWQGGLQQPLHLAIKKGQCEVARYLMSKFPYSFTDNENAEYLLCAILSCNLEMLKLVYESLLHGLQETSNHMIMMLKDLSFKWEIKHTAQYDALVTNVLKAGEAQLLSLLAAFENSFFSNNTTKIALFNLIEKYLNDGHYDKINQLRCFSDFGVVELIQKSVLPSFSTMVTRGQWEKIKEITSQLPETSEVAFALVVQYRKPEEIQFHSEYLQVSPHKLIKILHNDKIFEVTALSIAIKSQKLDNIKFLVETRKVDVNQSIYFQDANTQIRNELNPLQVAALTGNSSMVTYLIDKGAIVNDGAWLAAIVQNHLEIVKILLNTRLPISNDLFNGNQNVSIAAVTALKTGNLEILRLLLDKGAIIPTDFSLSIACESGSFSLFKYLIEDLKHALPEQPRDLIEFLNQVFRGKSIEVLKYLVEVKKLPIKEHLINDLDSDKPMYGDAWQMRNLFTDLFENGSIAMLRYCMEELKAYPSLDKLAFHINYLPDGLEKLFSKAYLLSLTAKENKQQQAFKYLSEKEFELLEGSTLKEIHEEHEACKNSYFSTHFKYRIRVIMRQKVATEFLVRTFRQILDEGVIRHIASYAELGYSYRREK